MRVLDRSCSYDHESSVDVMACHLWCRGFVAPDSLLLPVEDVEFEIVPKRSDQEVGPLWIDSQVLLEVSNWYLWSVVSLRLCYFS